MLAFNIIIKLWLYCFLMLGIPKKHLKCPGQFKTASNPFDPFWPLWSITKWPVAKARSARSPVKNSTEEHEETPPPVDRSKVPCIGSLTWLQVLTCCSSLAFIGNTLFDLITFFQWYCVFTHKWGNKCIETWLFNMSIWSLQLSDCFRHVLIIPANKQTTMSIEPSGILVKFPWLLQLLFSVCMTDTRWRLPPERRSLVIHSVFTVIAFPQQLPLLAPHGPRVQLSRLYSLMCLSPFYLRSFFLLPTRFLR